MVIGLVFALPALWEAFALALHPPAPPQPGLSVMEFVRQYGFPLLLIGGGYNLVSRDAFAALVDKVRSVLPGGKA